MRYGRSFIDLPIFHSPNPKTCNSMGSMRPFRAHNLLYGQGTVELALTFFCYFATYKLLYCVIP